MGKSTDHRPPPELDAAALEDESLSSNQEAVPVPWLAGERKIAVRWISQATITHTEKSDLAKK